MLQFVWLDQAPEHLAQIADWGYAAWDYPNADAVRPFLQQCIDAAPRLPVTLLAYSDGQLCGSVSVLTHEMGDAQPSEREFWLGFLVVDPYQRGQGIARKLMLAMSAQMAQRGITSLYCYTKDHADLYQTWGWMPIQQLVYQGHQVTVMRQNHDPSTQDPA